MPPPQWAPSKSNLNIFPLRNETTQASRTASLSISNPKSPLIQPPYNPSNITQHSTFTKTENPLSSSFDNHLANDTNLTTEQDPHRNATFNRALAPHQPNHIGRIPSSIANWISHLKSNYCRKRSISRYLCLQPTIIVHTTSSMQAMSSHYSSLAPVFA